jgi:hypothetical protein
MPKVAPVKSNFMEMWVRVDHFVRPPWAVMMELTREFLGVLALGMERAGLSYFSVA